MRKLPAALLVLFGAFLCAPLAAEEVSLARDSFRLSLYPSTGGFSVYRLSDVGKNRFEPLLEDRKGASTGWYTVSFNGKAYKLVRRGLQPVQYESLADGFKYVFTPTDDFQAEQSFTLIANPATGETCAVRIDTSVENTSGKPATFAVKALFDTMLGEHAGTHFSTNIRNRLTGETRLVSGIDPDTVLVSRDRTRSLMFLLQGFGTSRTESVYIANWERLNTRSWLPEYLEGRSFNTLYSVNDSAVLFAWPERALEPNKKLTVTLVLGLYTPELLPKPTVTAASAQAPATPPAPSASSSAKQLLVQEILDRIAEIQENPDSASDDELDKLNAALDVMLEQLKE